MKRTCVLAVVLAAAGALAAQPKPAAAPPSPRPGDDTLEQLQAQLDVKRAYVKAAEVGVAAAKAKYARVARAAEQKIVNKDEVEEAKLAVDAAAAQLDIRTAEMREVEVRIKQARDVKTAPPAPTEPKPAADGVTVRQLKAELEQAKAKVASARAVNQKVATELARVKQLIERGIVPQDEYLSAERAAQVAAIELKLAEAEVQLAEKRLAAAADKAPDPPAAAPPVAIQARPPVAVFNMAAVMRDFHKAKYQVYTLNKKRQDMSADLVKWRAEYIDLQQKVQKSTDAAEKEEMTERIRELARKVEDSDRRINKELNESATKIISGLYDEIKTEVDRLAAADGYDVVFAYPDAVTPQESANPYLKEMKLKPPAAQPFFVGKRVDVTKAVVEALNANYPPLDAAGKKVDVDKLPPVEGPPAAKP